MLLCGSDDSFGEQVQFLLVVEARYADIESEVSAIQHLAATLTTIGCFDAALVSPEDAKAEQYSVEHALDALLLHHTALRATVATVHRSMAAKKKYFSALLKEALTSLQDDVTALETAVNASELIDTATDPVHAEAKLSRYGLQLAEMSDRRAQCARYRELLHDELFTVPTSARDHQQHNADAASSQQNKANANANGKGCSDAAQDRIGHAIARVATTHCTRHAVWSAALAAQKMELQWLQLTLGECDPQVMSLQVRAGKGVYSSAVLALEASLCQDVGVILTVASNTVARCEQLATTVGHLHNR